MVSRASARSYGLIAARYSFVLMTTRPIATLSLSFIALSNNEYALSPPVSGARKYVCS